MGLGPSLVGGGVETLGKKCTKGPSTFQRDTKTSSNRKTRYTGSLNYIKPVTRNPSAFFILVLVYVTAESAWDLRGPHESACPGQPLSLSPLLSLLLLGNYRGGWGGGRRGGRRRGDGSTRRRGGGSRGGAASMTSGRNLTEAAATTHRSGSPAAPSAPPPAALPRRGRLRRCRGRI
jgi:uncharacterized membrane protein YgcG